jgi:hypothetical protein
MTEFLSALKADLLDRRLLPLLALAGVVLVAAIGYAVLGGGSSSTPPAPSTSAVASAASVPSASGIAVTQSTPEKAVAEVTSGSSEQRHGVARNPFNLLPGAKTAEASKSGSSTSGTSGAGAPSTATAGAGAKSGSEGSSGSGGSTEKSGKTTPKTPAKPTKPKAVYHVAVLFGVIPAGVSQQAASLTPFENLPLLSPLPSASQSLIVFRGVTAGGKAATFTLVSEAILHGNATCLPSASQCQAIDLAPGQTEQLEYISPTGEVTVYELRIVSIVSATASSAAVKNLLHRESKAGRELLRRSGLTQIPYLSNSSQAGVLVFAGHGARAARAHASAHQHQ